MRLIIFITIACLAALSYSRRVNCVRYIAKNKCAECRLGYFVNAGSCFKCFPGCDYCTGPLETHCLNEVSSIQSSNLRALSEQDLAMPSKTFNLARGFVLHGEIQGDNFIGLVEFNATKGWFALGFGESMTKADIIIFETNDNQITITDRWSKGHGRPAIDSSLADGKSDVTRLGYEIVNGNYRVKFSRKLNTGDAYDRVIVNGENPIIYAYGEKPTISIHKSFGQVTIDLSKSN